MSLVFQGRPAMRKHWNRLAFLLHTAYRPRAPILMIRPLNIQIYKYVYVYIYICIYIYMYIDVYRYVLFLVVLISAIFHKTPF